MTQNDAVNIWREKLDFLRQQEAIAADPAQKFQLLKQIEEAEAKLAELDPSSGATAADEAPAVTCDLLILAANPAETARLMLEEEARLIEERLQEAPEGRGWQVRVARAVAAEDIARLLLESNPRVVHFSGHGSDMGELLFLDTQGQSTPIAPEALAQLFRVVEGRTECVVLNACFSAERADAISDHVRCVIGMSHAIEDRSARQFAAGFYRGLAFGKGYHTAFELGCNELDLTSLPSAQVPRFITRDLDCYRIGERPQPETDRSHDKLFRGRPSGDEVTLWFGTNRVPVDSADPARGFSNRRDDRLHYGTCTVFVPESHKIGQLGSNWLNRLRRGVDDRLKLRRDTIATLAQEAFWESVRSRLQVADKGERSVLVFIHGYNVTFDEAALRAAQLGTDLQLRGMTAFYSWPSRGRFFGYPSDEASIESSEHQIAEFLMRFATDSGADRVHVVAHSMGNRGLVRSMERILASASSVRAVPFGQVILAAPDIDADVFRNLAGVFERAAERTTLYASQKDLALRSSMLLHNFARAGYHPPVTVVPGIDTIEVSNIDLTLLGHGYVANTRAVINDIYTALVHAAAPSQRPGLTPTTTADGQTYWRVRA